MDLPNNNENTEKAENTEELDLDSFFGSFDDLDPEDVSSTEAPAVQAAQTAEQADTVSEPQAVQEPVDFLSDTRKDIDSFLSGLDLSGPSAKLTFDDFDFGTQEPVPEPAPVASFFSAPPANSAAITPSQQTSAGDVSFKKPAAPVKAEEEEPEQTAPAEFAPEKKKEKISGGEIVRRIVLTVSILVIIGAGGYLVYRYIIGGMLADKTTDSAQGELLDEDDYTDLNSTDLYKLKESFRKKYPDVDFPSGMLIKYYPLYAQNQDFRGWITIPGFGIDLPICQGEDNDYYLKRDVHKDATDYGVPFFDYRNHTNFTDRNTIVYGHNLKYDKKRLFAVLENYRTIKGFKQAPVIRCDTLYNDMSWKVYAVFITNGKPAGDNGYCFDYLWTNLKNDKFSEYISEIDKRKLYTTGVDINETDEILTLSTCCYDFNNARLVVVARKVREGENTEVDFSKTVENANPRYPQAWYDANKKTNPYADDTNWKR